MQGAAALTPVTPARGETAFETGFGSAAVPLAPPVARAQRRAQEMGERVRRLGLPLHRLLGAMPPWSHGARGFEGGAAGLAPGLAWRGAARE